MSPEHIYVLLLLIPNESPSAESTADGYKRSTVSAITAARFIARRESVFRVLRIATGREKMQLLLLRGRAPSRIYVTGFEREEERREEEEEDEKKRDSPQAFGRIVNRFNPAKRITRIRTSRATVFYNTM